MHQNRMSCVSSVGWDDPGSARCLINTAISDHGARWRHNELAGPENSEDGFDSEMIEQPFVFD